MRVLIGIGGGLAVGLLFLVQALGLAYWCPPGLFTILHFPSAILVFALSQGEFNLVSPPSPFGVVLQWTFLGALVGGVLHLKQRPAASANGNAIGKDPELPSVPKTSFHIVRVICVIVGLLFLLSLLFWGWVIFTPHR